MNFFRKYQENKFLGFNEAFYVADEQVKTFFRNRLVYAPSWCR